VKVWVDADACPVVIRDILIKAALNRKVEMEFVANHFYQLPNSPYLNWRRVPQGTDQADKEIVDRVCAGDLVIATDLPLANDLIDKGASVLTHRGEALTKENIKARLNLRDFYETMRASGIQSGGQSGMSQADRREFANALDRALTAAQRQAKQGGRA
jgi:uncharacterized protein YaiI (UPF0178 family)